MEAKQGTASCDSELTGLTVPPFRRWATRPHRGSPQPLTDVVGAVADVGRDLLHALVVQHGLLLRESAGELLVDSSARGEHRVSQQPYSNTMSSQATCWLKTKHGTLRPSPSYQNGHVLRVNENK